MEAYGRVEVQFRVFLMPTLDGDELHALTAPPPGDGLAVPIE